MKIGILVPNILTSRKAFGKIIFAPYDLGIELADALVLRGHEVRFYGVPKTKTKAKLSAGDLSLLFSVLKKEKMTATKYHRLRGYDFHEIQSFFELDLVEKAYRDLKKGKVEILHHFHDNAAYFFSPFFENKRSLFTLHDPPPVDRKTARRFWVYEKHKNANYVTISQKQRSLFPSLNIVGTVPNGINLSDFSFSDKSGKYLAFMGRLLEYKGVHLAIKVAKKLKMPLKIAGKYFGSEKNDYFKKQIEPEIGKNKIELVGMLSGKAKTDFLKNAKALLFPILWEEPFGLVMIEAMACGTPVVAFNRGSVKEVMIDRKTGYIVKNVLEMEKAVMKIDQIDRRDCHEHVLKNFSIEKMAKGYEEVYQRLILK